MTLEKKSVRFAPGTKAQDGKPKKAARRGSRGNRSRGNGNSQFKNNLMNFSSPSARNFDVDARQSEICVAVKKNLAMDNCFRYKYAVEDMEYFLDLVDHDGSSPWFQELRELPLHTRFEWSHMYENDHRLHLAIKQKMEDRKAKGLQIFEQAVLEQKQRVESTPAAQLHNPLQEEPISDDEMPSLVDVAELSEEQLVEWTANQAWAIEFLRLEAVAQAEDEQQAVADGIETSHGERYEDCDGYDQY